MAVKPPLTTTDHITLLQSRGLIINDTLAAEQFLKNVSYYRFSGYLLPFEIPTPNGQPRDHRFILHTTFDDVLKYYILDKQLRLLIMEAIEIIEVAIRTRWANEFVLHTNDPYCYRDGTLFKRARYFTHSDSLNHLDTEINRSKETFVKHFKSRSEDLPLWAAVEVMSFGTLSKWVANTGPKKILKGLAHSFSLPPATDILPSYLHAITQIRNICAHHSRLWNRRFTFTIQKVNAFPFYLHPASEPRSHLIYNYIVATAAIVLQIEPQSNWVQKVYTLLKEISYTDEKAMGFPVDWRVREPWRNCR